MTSFSFPPRCLEWLVLEGFSISPILAVCRVRSRSWNASPATPANPVPSVSPRLETLSAGSLSHSALLVSLLGGDPELEPGAGNGAGSQASLGALSVGPAGAGPGRVGRASSSSGEGFRAGHARHGQACVPAAPRPGSLPPCLEAGEVQGGTCTHEDAGVGGHPCPCADRPPLPPVTGRA